MLTEAQRKQYFDFNEKENCVKFTGNKLECFIPQRYANNNYLIIGDKVNALGVFTMVIDDKITCGLQLPAVIEIEPNEIYEANVDDTAYTVCKLNKGNRLMTSMQVMQIDKIGYFMWTEFLNTGHMPSYVDYDNVNNLFDDLGECTGRGLPGNHAVFELILSHIYRDADNLDIKYRNTKMTKPPARVSLQDVSYGPSTTSGRILGSYSEIGLNSALIKPNKENSELEDIFRA